MVPGRVPGVHVGVALVLAVQREQGLLQLVIVPERHGERCRRSGRRFTLLNGAPAGVRPLLTICLVLEGPAHDVEGEPDDLSERTQEHHK